MSTRSNSRWTGLLGSILLKHLVDKTLRGMEAAVLAERFAGGRAYGYKHMVRLDANEEVQRELREIDEAQAEVVRRIFTWFAGGLSSIQIATRLNQERVPGPRAGQWTRLAANDDCRSRGRGGTAQRAHAQRSRRGTSDADARPLGAADVAG
jgi:hypothetical protein